MYARLLRLRRIRITGLVSFLLMECTIAVAVLLALAELVSWWAVPLLPVLVAAVVKINDMVGAPAHRSAGASPDDAPGPAPARTDSWHDEPAEERYDYDQYDYEQRRDHDGYDTEPAWADEHVAATQDWYADNPTQEIFLPPAVTGRPRQRSSDEADGCDNQPAYAGQAAYAESQHAGSYARAYDEPVDAGHGQSGWGRHSAPASGQTHAGGMRADANAYSDTAEIVLDRGDRLHEGAALAGAGRRAAVRTASDHRADTSVGARDDRAGARTVDDWAQSGDAEPAGGRPRGARGRGAGGGNRPADYWTRAAGTDAGRTTGASRTVGVPGGVAGTGSAQTGGGAPANLPGSSAPRRAQLFGAAVRRSMAAQAQQVGSGQAGRTAATSNDAGSGRHARGDAGGTGGRQMIRLNERGFNRLRDA
jgi:hypothetical protein